MIRASQSPEELQEVAEAIQAAEIKNGGHLKSCASYARAVYPVIERQVRKRMTERSPTIAELGEVEQVIAQRGIPWSKAARVASTVWHTVTHQFKTCGADAVENPK